MGTFTSKPTYIDFGFEASTKKARFNHNYTTLTVASYPSWISAVSIDYDSTKGTLTASVGLDATKKQLDGVIEITANDGATDFTHYVRVVYSYDSEHISLSNVVDNVMLLAAENSYITERDRTGAKLVAKRWVQDNGVASGTDIKFAELKVDGNKIYPPADFKDYMALYSVSDDGFLRPLYKNENINNASSYLTDQDELLLLDQNGIVLSGYGLTTRPNNENPYTYYGTTMSQLGTDERAGLYYNIRGGEYSSNGIYTYDRDRRVFVVDGVSDNFLVLKYISDPIIRDKMNIDSGGIRVHNDYLEALEKYIYKELLETKMSVPDSVKRRATQQYKLAMKRSHGRFVKADEILQALKGRNRYFTSR